MRHLICLTIDTDPDGLTAQSINRQSLRWDALDGIASLLEELHVLAAPEGSVPITWFLRADGQLESVFGSALYLVERFAALWNEMRCEGHEFGWHPHLYRQPGPGSPFELITNPRQAADEILRLWPAVKIGCLPFSAFRNGEGWHDGLTLETIEGLGFWLDSTAIPGRIGPAGHPMNWATTPSGPYFPDRVDIRVPGGRRGVLEIPISTWHLQAPFDSSPKVRYINPAFHPELFHQGLQSVRSRFNGGDLRIWTLVVHPDEAFAGSPADQLYSRSPRAVRTNLELLASALREESGAEVQFVTMTQAAREWLRFREAA
jgi:hypothetical protein